MKNQKYKALWAPAAEKDLEEIVMFIAESNPIDAISVLERIKSTANEILKFPNKSRIVPKLKELSIMSYRQHPTNPWRVIFRVSENLIYILAVIDSRRDIEEILINRIIQERY